MGWTLVTGGAKGLGRDICIALAKNGYPVLVHYRNSLEQAKEVVSLCREIGVPSELVQGDFSSTESVVEFIEDCKARFSSIQSLVNNVGPYIIGKAIETSVSTWHEIFQINFFTPLALIQAFTGSIKREKGSIINIGLPRVEEMRAETYAAAYAMAKSLLHKLTITLAKELAPSGISVNMVSPGHMESSVDLQAYLGRLPMGRPALGEEVARIVTFFLEEKNRYLTGQHLEVAGGFRL